MQDYRGDTSSTAGDPYASVVLRSCGDGSMFSHERRQARDLVDADLLLQRSGGWLGDALLRRLVDVEARGRVV